MRKKVRMGDDESRKEEMEERRRGRPKNAARLTRGRTGSEGNIAELWAGKRKAAAGEGREEEDMDVVGREREAFKKSKIIARSPEKKEETEDLLRGIMEKLEGVVRREVGKVERRVEEMTRGSERRVEEMVREARREREEMIKRWEEERKGMMDRIEELEKRTERMEAANKERAGAGGGARGQGWERKRWKKWKES